MNAPTFAPYWGGARAPHDPLLRCAYGIEQIYTFLNFGKDEISGMYVVKGELNFERTHRKICPIGIFSGDILKVVIEQFSEGSYGWKGWTPSYILPWNAQNHIKLRNRYGYGVCKKFSF